MDIYNNKKNLFYKLKSSCKKEWTEYTEHKFLLDLVNNKLADKNFKKYLVQDFIFLQQFLKILALSVYRSNSFEEINKSVNFIKGIDQEIKLHINYCKKWRIPIKSLNNLASSPISSSVNNSLCKFPLPSWLDTEFVFRIEPPGVTKSFVEEVKIFLVW